MSGKVGGVPAWAIVAGAVAVVALVVVLGLLSSIYLGLAVVIVGALAVAAVWAWARLPQRFGEGPDKAEESELEKRHEEMEEERREKEEQERRKRGEGGEEGGGEESSETDEEAGSDRQ
jgi:membrane protein implicated in regulation of membrane protease activity